MNDVEFSILDRIKAIEDRLDALELQETTFEFSRDKTNARNIVTEISLIKAAIGIPGKPTQVHSDEYWLDLNKA